MSRLSDWWQARILEQERLRFSVADWERVWASLPLLNGLGPVEAERLADLALLFLRDKSLEPAQGLQLTASMRLTFSKAYEALCRQVNADEETAIDPYAAESPAEFFAVVSEAFFEVPALLAGEYPEVYAQLRAFYRQDPLAHAPAVWPVGATALDPDNDCRFLDQPPDL